MRIRIAIPFLFYTIFFIFGNESIRPVARTGAQGHMPPLLPGRGGGRLCKTKKKRKEKMKGREPKVIQVILQIYNIVCNKYLAIFIYI